MTGSAYLGALLPVTSSWAVAPMAGQFALRGQSGAPRRLSAPVFLNGGGGRGSERSAPCLGWVQCSLARTDMFQPCCHAGCHSLPGRESARSCRAPAMQYPFHLRGRRSTITSPRGGIVMTSLVLSDSRIAQSSLCSARTVWLPSAETWSKANSPWQLENKRFGVA